MPALYGFFGRSSTFQEAPGAFVDLDSSFGRLLAGRLIFTGLTLTTNTQKWSHNKKVPLVLVASNHLKNMAKYFILIGSGATAAAVHYSESNQDITWRRWRLLVWPTARRREGASS